MLKLLVLGVVVVLGLSFVSMNLSGCAAIPLAAGFVGGQMYKSTVKECPYCKSWIKKDAIICSQCGKNYPKDGKLPEGYSKDVEK